MRRIPAAGINLFQLIYVLIREHREKTGEEPLNLSLGNPDGVPPADLLELQAKAARDPRYEHHTYAEDNDLAGFAGAMVRLHGGVDAAAHPHLRALPIAGIKTASALMPLACGLHLPGRKRRDRFVLASNLPAYDVIGTWSASYLAAERVVWPLVAEDGMRLNLARLKDALKDAKAARPDLVFVIRPGNPAAVGANANDWKALIEYCVAKKARLVNDAAYAGLAAAGSHVSLASVAKDYPELEWIEMYSISKSFNDPGARLGALIGSRDFVADFVLVKGNTDSGPVPSMMAAYGEYLNGGDRAARALADIRGLYRRRLDYLIPRLSAAGLRPACATEAGFFTLWKTPKAAFGKKLPAKGRHEAFNRAAIGEAGIVGVHFAAPGADGGVEPLIRYAVCADVLSPAFQARFEERLTRLKPEY
jgi:alanine-synthesizing transaminase